jgi:hypothetical protein
MTTIPITGGPGPITPYPEPDGSSTSGHSGTDTSRERAVRDDSNGTTGKRQSDTLGYAAVFGVEGITVKDLREMTDWHHGVASSVLSNLHMAERLARLAERRDRCAVYVLPEHVGGRETQPHARNAPKPSALTPEEAEVVHLVRTMREKGWAVASVRVDSLLAIIDRLAAR